MKEWIISEVDLLKENQEMLKRVMSGMRRSIQIYLQSNGRHIEGNRTEIDE